MNKTFHSILSIAVIASLAIATVSCGGKKSEQQTADGELSGNIFTLKLNGRDAEITNEITGSELTVTRDELKALAADYSAEVKRLRKRS